MASLILLCWVAFVVGPHRGHVFVRHQPVDTLQDTLFGKCHLLRKEPARVCACVMDIIQYVNVVLPGLGIVDTFSSEREDLRAPLPSRFSRDIPNETVKALVFCLVLTIFWLRRHWLFFSVQTPAGPRFMMFLRKFDSVDDSRSMAHRLFVITFVWSWRRIMQTIHTGTRDQCGELSQAGCPKRAQAHSDLAEPGLRLSQHKSRRCRPSRSKTRRVE